MNKLSSHFTLDEMLVSQTAARLGIDNTPSEHHIKNLTRLARVLEDVRMIYGKPLIVSSGYRCPELNKVIGGSPTSAHQDGRAVDFTIPGIAPLEVCIAIVGAGIEVDQCIHEFGKWIHLGIATEDQPSRRQLLTATRQNGRTVYLPGLLEVA